MFLGIISAVLGWILLTRAEQIQASSEIFGNPGIAGIFGSLLGATVAGSATFLAAIYSQRQQTAARGAVLRKNTIYTPLFDELVSVRAILKENPYPSRFEIGAGRQTAMPHPIFGAWERIKSDTRIIQVPQYIANSLEEYTEGVLIYRSLRGEAARDVQEKMNQILGQEHNAEFELRNIGETLLSNVILGEEPARRHLTLKQEIAFQTSGDSSTQPKLDLTEQEVDHLASKIHEQCNKLASVKQLVEAYEESVNKLEDLIRTLATIIEVISKKYERHRGWF